MVREVHMSWDSEQPLPSELARSQWDLDETEVDVDTLVVTRSRKQRLDRPARPAEQNSRPTPE